MIKLVSYVVRFLLFIFIGGIIGWFLAIVALILWESKWLKIASDIYDELNPNLKKNK